MPQSKNIIVIYYSLNKITELRRVSFCLLVFDFEC